MSSELPPVEQRFQLPTVELAPVAPRNLPAVIPTTVSSRALVVIDKLGASVPRATAVTVAGGAWLTSLVAQCFMGGSTLVLGSIVATGVVGGIALLPSLKRASTPARTPAPDSEETTKQQLGTRYNFIFDNHLTAQQRLDHTLTYAKLVSALTAEEACKILGAVTCGLEWGLPAPKPKTFFRRKPPANTVHEKVVRELGLGSWAAGWTSCEIEVAYRLLPKVMSATPAEKTKLEEQAVRLLSGYYERDKKVAKYNADLLAGASELIRRIPESPPVSTTP